MRAKISKFTLFIFILLLTPNLGAEDVQVSTYVSSPKAVYKDLKVRNSFTHTNNSITGHGDILVKDNADASAPQGGVLSVFQLLAEALPSEAYEFGSRMDVRFWELNDSPKITHVPSSGVAGSSVYVEGWDWVMRTKIARGYSDPADFSNSAMYEISHASDDINDKNNGFAGVTGIPGVNLRHISLYLDGDPIRFMVDPVTQTALPGQVIIRGEAVLGGAVIPPGDTPRLVVGRAIGTATNVASQSLTITSLRSAKYDISYLDQQAYSNALQELRNLDVMTFRYKGESEKAKKSIGFIAEHSPDTMTDLSKKFVNINDTIGLLMASAKALQNENDQMKQKIKELKQ